MFTAVMSFYLWRDLRLSLFPPKLLLPDVVVEDIELNRVIEGNKWHIIAARAEHRDGVIYGDSLDVTITAASGDVTRIKAEKGVFTREHSDLTFENANGSLAQGEKTYFLKSGHIFYDAAAKIWYFTNGVTLFDGTAEASGPEGRYDANTGVSTITGGSRITWRGEDDASELPKEN